jgi:hypothetical protein
VKWYKKAAASDELERMVSGRDRLYAALGKEIVVLLEANRERICREVAARNRLDQGAVNASYSNAIHSVQEYFGQG